MTTNEILDRLKAEYNLTSDYQLAKKLDISRARVSNYRNMNTNMDDDLVLKVEDLLEMPEGTLLLEMHAERSKCPEAAKILHKISKQLLAAAASVIVVITMTFGINIETASANISGQKLTNNIHYADLIRSMYKDIKIAKYIYQRIYTKFLNIALLEAI